ncbi:MAG TPA: M20/M25/M40 family metallo-hydrolase [Candidatus Acidoferrum sp.]|nr:M20/M25/M40 family metallo-hydrolase [Candidatus Acidoferrum sp.]
MKKNRKVASVAGLALCLVVGRAWTARAANEESNPVAAADAKILSEIHDHSELMENLEYLSDEIGPRLTGSPELKRANDWTAEMFKKYGLTNVHLEAYSIPHAWERGKASARIIAPTEHPLTIASAAWTPGTKGKVHGPVVYFDAKEPKDFEKFKGKLRGAIVIAREPQPLSPPRQIDQNREIYHPLEEPPARVGEPAKPDPYDKYLETLKARYKFWKDEGVMAVLADSNKPHALLNMTDGTTEPFEMGPLPSAFVTGEGYRMIYRMLKKGPVEVEIEISNSLSKKPVEVYNTVGEIRGAEKPDEVVILGAHLDSWDLGTGSTDNGTGSMAVLEAARTLAKLDLKPKRTIRFILFTGEEQGLIGSKEYVKAHKSELGKISGALIHDSGTGRVLAIGLHDNYQDRPIVDQIIAPLGELKMLEPTTAREYGTDSLSFDEVGVPGFWCAQDIAEYFKTHHSQSDTFDKIWKDDINQGAQVLAAWAYSTAQLAEMLPRRPVPPIAPAGAMLAKPKSDPIEETDKKIIEQVKGDAEKLKGDLTYLTTQIGPRLTGSPQLDRASHWTEEQFKALGLENTHLESWSIANSWTRGPATGRIVSPAVHELTLAGAGWSPATNGTVKGEVIGVDAEKIEDLEKYKGKLGGKIVIVTRPREMEAPGDPMLTPFGQAAGPLNHPKNQANFDYRAYMQMRAALTKMLTEEKALAMLTGSEKMYGLMNMSTASREYQPAAFPSAYLEREDYLLIWRMLEAGTPVQVELNLQGSFSGKPVEVYNTVAEIRGTEKPDEVVILGAHLDSWDLGTGATDNGTGSMAVLEAARALQKLGVKPKRTIRFVLFTGEEQGLNGSKAYVQAHKDELAKISGVLVHDTGTGKVLTIGLMGNYNVRETMDRVLYPMAEPLGIMEPTLRSEGGSDHVPFDAAGVPGFWCVQEVADYDKMHHSQADVLDHVRWDDLTEGAQVLAVFAYNVAELPELLPRKPMKKEEAK